jgi:hypothetical protein
MSSADRITPYSSGYGNIVRESCVLIREHALSPGPIADNRGCGPPLTPACLPRCSNESDSFDRSHGTR